jgi:RNA processing factor Prp31
MNRMHGTLALALAGLLTLCVTVWPGSRADAQGTPEQPQEQWRQQLEQKYQEEWEEQHKPPPSAAERQEKAEKRQMDAERRQREAERRQRELEQQEDE